MDPEKPSASEAPDEKPAEDAPAAAHADAPAAGPSGDADDAVDASKEEPELAEASQSPAAGGDQRIQFAPGVRQPRKTPIGGPDDGIAITQRSHSVASIPQVLSEKEKVHRKEQEKRQVNIDEHLMPHGDVADRYKTRINMEKPAESLGLTTHLAETLLQEHGPNVLTPPKKRHPFLKFLDSLTSLFNLLLIIAGILEYILLGIDFKNNFQNVGSLLCA